MLAQDIVSESFKKVLSNYFQSAVIPSYSTEQGECFAYKFSIFHLFHAEMVHRANLRTFHKFMASSKNGIMVRVIIIRSGTIHSYIYLTILIFLTKVNPI